MGPEARILILDNHDDFGGHAKRNEFHRDGRMVLGLGGAQNIENHTSYSQSSTALLNGLGLSKDVLDGIRENTPNDYAMGGNYDAQNSMALPGANGHVVLNGNWVKMLHGADGYVEAIRGLPLAESEQDKLIDFVGGERDYLEELSLSEKYDYANSVSYNQFLVERVGLEEGTLPLFSAWLMVYKGLSGWNLSVLEAIVSGAAGLRAMGWLGGLVDSLSVQFSESLLDVRMFPDGNASIARLLVKQLIPAVAPKMKGVEDVAISKFNYPALDKADNKIRIRLNSTVVGVREKPDNKVHIDYVKEGEPLRISASHCVLACYNGLIPHLSPELPEAQKEALKYGVKVPFVYANVLLENGQAFSKLGTSMIQCPQDPLSDNQCGPHDVCWRLPTTE